MSLIVEKCIEFSDKRKFCVASENGKTYRLENESGYQIKKVAVDKCLSQQLGEKRCDFLFSIDEIEQRQVIFVELKGGALSKALHQLLETIKYLKKEFANYRIDARIVGSRDTPSLTSLPIHRELKTLLSKNKGTLVRATNNNYTEKV